MNYAVKSTERAGLHGLSPEHSDPLLGLLCVCLESHSICMLCVFTVAWALSVPRPWPTAPSSLSETFLSDRICCLNLSDFNGSLSQKGSHFNKECCFTLERSW